MSTLFRRDDEASEAVADAGPDAASDAGTEAEAGSAVGVEGWAWGEAMRGVRSRLERVGVRAWGVGVRGEGGIEDEAAPLSTHVERHRLQRGVSDPCLFSPL